MFFINFRFFLTLARFLQYFSIHFYFTILTIIYHKKMLLYIKNRFSVLFEHFLFVCIVKQKQTKSLRIYNIISWIFKIWWNLILVETNFEILKFWSSVNLPWGHVRFHKKFGPDRFSRFDVYWIQTDKQTDKNKQTSQIKI